MQDNHKIILSLSIVLILTSSILILIESSVEPYFEITDNIHQDPNEFFSQDFSSSKTVFLMGSSQVGVLNATKINEMIDNSNAEKIEIYNLSTNANSPSKEIKRINIIIDSKPDLIIYGISYRAFSFPYSNNIDQNKILDISSATSNIWFNLEEKIMPHNPQLIVQNFLKNTLGKLSSSDDLGASKRDKNTPFIINKYESKIPNQSQLKNYLFQSQLWNDSNIQHKNIDALEKIISKLQDNNIEIILYLTPLHITYLENLSENQKNSMNQLIEKLSEKYGIKIIDWTYRYVDLNIWSDPGHVSRHQSVTIYNDDITELILENLR